MLVELAKNGIQKSAVSKVGESLLTFYMRVVEGLVDSTVYRQEVL